jgi:hypothetical protein
MNNPSGLVSLGQRCSWGLEPRARIADYLLGRAGTERRSGEMEEFALTMRAALGGLEEVRENLELLREQLETAREIAGRPAFPTHETA